MDLKATPGYALSATCWLLGCGGFRCRLLRRPIAWQHSITSLKLEGLLRVVSERDQHRRRQATGIDLHAQDIFRREGAVVNPLVAVAMQKEHGPSELLCHGAKALDEIVMHRDRLGMGQQHQMS